MYRFDAYGALGTDDLRLFWALLDRLPYEPKSAFRAESLGGMAHFGWGEMLHTLTTVAELIQQNTAVTNAAGSGRKPKKTLPMYRPAIQREQQPQSLTDVDWSFFGR